MNDMPGYAAAQREYDNRTPPDDGPSQCPDCKGGYRYTTDAAENEHEIKCETCAGHGFIDDNGKPFDPHAAEREACERADAERDRRLVEHDQDDEDLY